MMATGNGNFQKMTALNINHLRICILGRIVPENESVSQRFAFPERKLAYTNQTSDSYSNRCNVMILQEKKGESNAVRLRVSLYIIDK